METWILHPKVDCLGNQAEEKEPKGSKRGTKVPKAPVAQRIDCQLPSLYRLQGPLKRVGPMPVWGYSSVGRAPALQAGGHRFEPGYLHQYGSLAQLVRALA